MNTRLGRPLHALWIKISIVRYNPPSTIGDLNNPSRDPCRPVGPVPTYDRPVGGFPKGGWTRQLHLRDDEGRVPLSLSSASACLSLGDTAGDEELGESAWTGRESWIGRLRWGLGWPAYQVLGSRVGQDDLPLLSGR